MPQAKSGGSRSSSGSSARSTSGRSPAKRASGASSGRSSSGRSTAAKRSSATKAKSSKSTSGARSTSRARSTSSGRSTSRARSTSSGRSTASKSTSAAEAQLEAVAKRLRKLNERIIEAGREAGETTLSSYEKALKTIAGTLERGPGRSDVEWISNLATAQAKFIRDLTTSWTSAARKALK